MDYIKRLNESIKFIESKLKVKPEIGIVLGSGLGGLADKIEDKIVISYEEIPNFPISTVEGHEGKLIIGKIKNKNVIAMQGRFHYYEGYDIKDVVLPTRVIIGLGINSLILTNAAGGVDINYKPGDLMIINDHINFTGVNPLIGKNYDELGPRFPDQTTVYDKKLQNIAKESAKEIGIDIKEGVYIWMTGPTYETPAEIKMARLIGGTAVGMSTVPEVIVAAHQGIKVLGISCITNMAAGILDQPLNHEEVVETSLKVKDDFENLINKIIEKI